MSQIRAFALAAALAVGVTACAPRPEAGAVRSAEADDKHPGKAVYQANCASCHDDGERSGAPSLAAIRQLNRSTVEYALTLGYMSQQAKHVPAEELKQVIDWIPNGGTSNDDWINAARCPMKIRDVEIKGAARTSETFGVTYDANRHETAERAGLNTQQMKNLEVAWVIAFPATPTMRSQPVIIGNTIFIAATDSGRLFALDTNSGCVKWMYASDMTLRSSLTFAETGGDSGAIILGDAAGRVHAVDAKTGAKLWVTDVKLTSLNRITGAPVVHDGKVITPVSVIESNFPPDDGYECCKGQGAVVALDLKTGKKLWVGRTMEDAKPTRIGRSGTQQYGPAGAMIWSTPVVDAKRNVVYAGSGESLSWPATDTSDSIIAYDMNTGERKWVFQASRNDIWNSACGRRGANCDWPGEYWSPDFDFGGTSMLVNAGVKADGSTRQLVIAGQKSGVVWALDPDEGGKMVWSNRVSRGSASGGIHWGMAYDDKAKTVFAPSNDAAGSADNPNWGPGIHALDVATGEIKWSYHPNARDCGQDLPVATANVPAPEWKITAVTAPLQPPPRPTAAPAARPGAAPAARPGAAPATPAITPAAVPGAALAAAAPAAPAAAAPRPARCRLGFSPAPLLVDGALVTGTPQGMLRIFDGSTGEVLFEYMTNREFPETTNGLPGHGGGLDSAPYIAGDGKLFVQSGYARFGEPPGNVLIAFKPKAKK